MPSPSLPAPPRCFWWALLALVLIATAARASLQFGTPLAPGINGAYYFVQARAVLETGALGVPDLPFIFWLHAGLAWTVQTISGIAREDAIVWAVKSADSLLPALIAWPLGLLGWRLQATRPAPSVLAALAPAALACLGAQALNMTGDFQKNSLALVWLASLGLGAHSFIAAPSWRTARLPLTSLALLGLTHVGVLATSLLFAACLGVGALLTIAPESRRKLVVVAGAGGLILTAAATLIYHAYDPVRVKRLVNALTDPAALTSSNRVADRSPPGAVNDPRSGPGPRRGPPGSGPMQSSRQGALVAFSAVVIAAGLWQRKKLSPADRTLIAASALTAAAVGGPWFDGDKAMRLVPMAIVLVAVPLPFLLRLIPGRLGQGLASILVICGSAASAVLYLPRGGEPTIGENAFEELRALAPLAEPTSRTLIVARHGLEWWTAWVLHTRIAQPSAVTAEDWSKFDRVLYLVENDSPSHHGRPSPDGPPDDGDFPPPPEGNFGPGPRRGPGADPFRNRLPENARILQKGAALTLAQADAPPASLTRTAGKNAPRR